MKTKKVFFYIITLILGGCIPIMSLNPFYTKSDVFFEGKLLGFWLEGK